MVENIDFCMKMKEDLQNIAKAKNMAIREMNGLPPIPPPWQEELKTYCVEGCNAFFCSTFCSCYHRPKLKFKKINLTFLQKLKTEGTYENDVLKNFIGFLGGFVVSIVLFYLCVLQLRVGVETAAILGSIMGCISCIGLAFSETYRCITLLVIPNFFSSKGRMFLMMYATILLINYPILNFNHNVIVLTDCATCGQSMAMNETRELVEMAKAPFAGMIKDIKAMLQAIRTFADRIKAAFRALCNALNEIKAEIARMFSWIAAVAEACNRIMGIPYRRCSAAFQSAVDKCFDQLPPFVEMICHVVTVIQQVCQVTRVGEVFCKMASWIHNFIQGLFDFDFGFLFDQWRNMFYFNVTLEYHYNFTTKQSKSYEQVRKEIMGEIQEKLDKLNNFLAFTDNMMMYLAMLVIVRAVYYRQRYLAKDTFDNRYITSNIIKINEARDAFCKEKALPLKKAERRLYVHSLTPRLSRQEGRKMFKGFVLLLFSVCHASFFMMCDYGLYWLLALIQTHMEIKTHSDLPPHFALHVQGEGALADMYRTLISILDPGGTSGIEIDTTKCLPNPSIPNIRVYKSIYSIYFTVLILSVFEAYGLRLRHVIAGCYNPIRERERSIWLYNHILVMRGDFLKFARRQLKHQNCTNKALTRLSIRSRLIAQFPMVGKFLKLLGLHNKKVCLLCAREGVTTDYDNFEHCSTPSCDAVYCSDCFGDLNNLCTVCMNPIEYEDMSDVSEEKDSSEDEAALAQRMKQAKERKEKILKMKERRRPSKVMVAFHRMLVDVSDGEEKQEKKSDPSEEAVPDPENVPSDNESDEMPSSEDEVVEELDMSYQYKGSDCSDISEEEIFPDDKKPKRKIDKVSMDIFDYSDSEEVATAAPPTTTTTQMKSKIPHWTPGQALDSSVLESMPPEMLESLGPEILQMLTMGGKPPEPQNM